MNLGRFLGALLMAASFSAVPDRAVAVETFKLAMSGTGTFETDFQSSSEVLDTFNWIGEVTVQTSSGANGVYSGTDVLSFSGFATVIDSAGPLADLFVPIGSMVFNFGASSRTLSGPVFGLLPGAVPPQITISGGRVSSIHAVGVFPGEVGSLVFSDLSVVYGVSQPGPPGSITGATGVLSPVPEPDALALMILGIVTLGAVSRRRHRAGTVESPCVRRPGPHGQGARVVHRWNAVDCTRPNA